MISICSEQLTTQYLKEDIGHFRNVCQHNNMSLLENVLKTLKAKSDEVIEGVETKESEERLKSILSDDSPQNVTFLNEGADIQPEDLVLLANC